MTIDFTQQRETVFANCKQEPVHTPGVIQPFGALLVSDRTLGRVTQVSSNIAAHIVDNDQATELLGQPLDEILPTDLMHDLSNACGLPEVMTQRQRLGIYQLWEQPFDVAVHCTNTRTLIEVEPIGPNSDSPTPLVMRAKAMLGNVTDSDELLSLAVKELRNVTGFDRVMAYRFLADGAGEVVAEACSPGAESYLGLRYPASDFPELSRDLFLKTGVRMIADVATEQVPVLALDENEAALDLSLALLRGFSPVHGEYLSNMGAQASMAIAISVNGKLWGLFSLHHLHPKLLSTDVRTVAELFSQLFSLQFQQVLAEERFRDRKRTTSTLDKLLSLQSQTPSPRDWKTDITEAAQPLCQLLSAQGVGFVSEQTVFAHYGDVPAALLDLVDHYQRQAPIDLVTTACLQTLDIPTVTTWGKSAGALYFQIPADSAFHIVFFRNEIIQEIAWAGNPEGHELLADPSAAGGLRLHPRRSFEQYKQTVMGQCQPWTEADLNTALEIRTELVRLAQVKIQDFQQRQQNLLVAELNHRVKNILALIRSIARQTKTSSVSLTDYAKTLESRIAALSTAHDLVTVYGLEWPNLRDLLAIELQPYLSGSRISLSGPAVGLKANFVPTFVLVLHELTSNAAKYGALSVSTGQLTVSWSERDGGIKLHWQELNGPPVTPPKRIGFGQGLIERAIPYEFDGEATLQFLPAGVQVDFWLPNNLIRWTPKTDTTTIKGANETTPTSPDIADEINVLVVEDSLLIAMEMEDMLKTLDFGRVNCVSTVANALKSLQQVRYDFCVLDIDLKKETSFAIAYRLLEENIPFIFTSGYNAKHPIPEDLKAILLLKKPIDLSTLEASIQTMLKRRGETNSPGS